MNIRKYKKIQKQVEKSSVKRPMRIIFPPEPGLVSFFLHGYFRSVSSEAPCKIQQLDGCFFIANCASLTPSAKQVKMDLPTLHPCRTLRIPQVDNITNKSPHMLW